MENNHLKLKRLTEYSNVQLMNELENNFVYFLNFALLRAGAFFNVVRPTTGIHGTWHKLTLANDGNLTRGRVWQSVRKDWVWETAIEYARQPILTRIYVNGVEYARDHAQYGHYINFPLGQVVFNNVLPTNSVVEASYSFRNIQVYKENDARWWRELHYGSFKPNDPQFVSSDKGSWSIGTSHRIQFPALIVAAVANADSKPYSMGPQTLVRNQIMRFRVVAESAFERNQLIDILLNQHDKVTKLFDTDTVSRAGVAPLNEKGDINPTGVPYNQLVTLYPAPLSNVIWRDPTSHEIETYHPNLYEGQVIVRCEVIIP